MTDRRRRLKLLKLALKTLLGRPTYRSVGLLHLQQE